MVYESCVLEMTGIFIKSEDVGNLIYNSRCGATELGLILSKYSCYRESILVQTQKSIWNIFFNFMESFSYFSVHIKGDSVYNS